MTRLFWLFRWLQWFWWVKVCRRTDKVCHPDCALCEVNRRQEAHYDGCAECQGGGYPCAAMQVLNAEEQRVIPVVFTDLDGPTSASSSPVIVFPPWTWPKKP